MPGRSSDTGIMASGPGAPAGPLPGRATARTVERGNDCRTVCLAVRRAVAASTAGVARRARERKQRERVGRRRDELVGEGLAERMVGGTSRLRLSGRTGARRRAIARRMTMRKETDSQPEPQPRTVRLPFGQYSTRP